MSKFKEEHFPRKKSEKSWLWFISRGHSFKQINQYTSQDKQVNTIRLLIQDKSYKYRSIHACLKLIFGSCRPSFIQLQYPNRKIKILLFWLNSLLVLLVHFRVITLDPDLRSVNSRVSALILSQYCVQ